MEDDKVYKDFFEIIYPIIKDKPFILKDDEDLFIPNINIEFYVGEKIDEHSVYVYWFDKLEGIKNTKYNKDSVGSFFFDGSWIPVDLPKGINSLGGLLDINKINTEEIFNQLYSEWN